MICLYVSTHLYSVFFILHYGHIIRLYYTYILLYFINTTNTLSQYLPYRHTDIPIHRYLIPAIPLEDYLIHTLRESQVLRESLKQAWDGEVYRECTFTPFCPQPATTAVSTATANRHLQKTSSHSQLSSVPFSSSKSLRFVDAIPSPIGW